MKWCGTSIEKPLSEIQIPRIYEQFVQVDPKTQSIKREIYPFEQGSKKSYSEKWQRIKFKAVNIAEIKNYLKKKGEHFIDPNFPHNSRSLSDEEQVGIKWKRIHDIIPGAIYAKEYKHK